MMNWESAGMLMVDMLELALMDTHVEKYMDSIRYKKYKGAERAIAALTAASVELTWSKEKVVVEIWYDDSYVYRDEIYRDESHIHWRKAFK